MTATPRVILYCLSLSFILISSTALAWYDVNYQYRRRITIDHTQVGSGTHTDFPFLVTAACFDAAFFTHVAKTTPINNLDIIFVDSDDLTKLDREIVDYDQAGNRLEAWVRIPSLSNSTDKVIYVYYGYAGANEPNNLTTWSSAYRAVYHLQSYSNPMTDSTVNLNHAAPQNMNASDSVAAKIGRGVDLNGVDEYMTVAGTSASLQITGNLTLSAWMRPQSLTRNEYDRLISKKNTWNGANGYELEFNASAGIDRAAIGGGGNNQALAGAPGFSTNWTYMTGVVGDPDTTHGRIYVNGVNRTTDDTIGALAAGTETFCIGSTYTNALFQGTLDEVRVQSVARSAGWIATEYNNQNAPASFVSVAAEETPVFGSPTATPTLTPPGTETPSSTATPT